MKVAPAVKFEVDTVFEQAERVEKLLREDAAARADASPPPSAATRGRATSDDDDARRVDGGRRRRRPQRRGAGDRQAARADVVRRRPAGAARGRRRGGSGTAARSIRRRRACCRSAWARRPSSPQFLLDADKQYDVHGLLRRRDRHRRRGGRRHRAPRRGRRRRGGACARALAAVPRPDHAGAADLLGAQAGGAAALRLRARRRDGRGRAAQRGRARAGADVVRRPGGGRRCTMRCSKGTYVRALARDLGRALGVGAHVTALRRTRSGPFSLAEARPLDEVLAALPTGRRIAAALPLVEPADGAAPPRTAGRDSDDVARDVALGRRIALEPGELAGRDRPSCACSTASGKLVAVARARAPDRTLELLRVFHAVTH